MRTPDQYLLTGTNGNSCSLKKNIALSARTCPQVKTRIIGEANMETQPQHAPILEVAWRRFAQLDAVSLKRSKAHLRLRRWVAALGILTTLFAILSQLYAESLSPLAGWILKFIFIVTQCSFHLAAMSASSTQLVTG
jgi:hypothetical protein